MTTDRQRADHLRAFNRFYTRHIGVLGDKLPGRRFSLTESRLLWELAQGDTAQAGGHTASALVRELQLDAGYLSRLLASLRERGLVKALPAPHDKRQTLLSLTAAGRRAFAPLDKRSQAQAAGLLAALPEDQQHELLQAAQHMQRLLQPGPRATPVLRALAPGDLGWVVSRHGALYAQAHGWDMRFEALVARIAANYIEQLNPQLEAAWIAEIQGRRVGCIFLVQARDDTSGAVLPGIAQLRMLLVEPQARGSGLGTRLTAECERFARAAGYRSIRLWTNSMLVAARGIYQAVGYQMQASEAHHSFGHDLVGEVWEKTLAP